MNELKIWENFDNLQMYLRRQWVHGGREWLSGMHGSKENDKDMFGYTDAEWNFIWSTMLSDGAWAVPAITDKYGNIVKDNLAPELFIKFIAHDVRCHVVVFDLILNRVQFCSANHLKDNNVLFDAPILLYNTGTHFQAVYPQNIDYFVNYARDLEHSQANEANTDRSGVETNCGENSKILESDPAAFSLPYTQNCTKNENTIQSKIQNLVPQLQNVKTDRFNKNFTDMETVTITSTDDNCNKNNSTDECTRISETESEIDNILKKQVSERSIEEKKQLSKFWQKNYRKRKRSELIEKERKKSSNDESRFTHASVTEIVESNTNRISESITKSSSENSQPYMDDILKKKASERTIDEKRLLSKFRQRSYRNQKKNAPVLSC